VEDDRNLSSTMRLTMLSYSACGLPSYGMRHEGRLTPPPVVRRVIHVAVRAIQVTATCNLPKESIKRYNFLRVAGLEITHGLNETVETAVTKMG
jgi:hypothetical protein